MLSDALRWENERKKERIEMLKGMRKDLETALAAKQVSFPIVYQKKVSFPIFNKKESLFSNFLTNKKRSLFPN